MKKLLLCVTSALLISFSSNAQVVDYMVPVTDLINMTVQTGDMCFDPNEYKQTSPGTVWGFQWNSTNANTPVSINVDFISVSDEGLMIPTTLNGMTDNTVSMNPSSCGLVGQLFSLTPANYNPNGLNTLLLDYSASTITAQIIPFGPTYAHVEVNYGSVCTDPDVPTLTASSPICPSSTSTINISGNLNDATSWEVYTGSCGGTSDGSTAGSSYVASPSTTTTYYIRGEGGCVVPGSCASITISVDDAQAPVPDNASLSDVTAECSANPTAPTATDNCAGSVTGTPDVTLPITSQGTTVITWTYDDGNGNSTTQTQNVILDDITDPVPDNLSLSDVNAECSASPAAPTATDNCAGALMATPDVTFPITAQGTTVVTWTYDDGNGNTVSQTQNVVLNDVSAPIADSPTLADVNEECSTTPVAPTATDNCAGSITGTPDVTFPITTQGTTIVTWTYDDGNGNQSTQTQNVNIVDVTAPTITQCPGNSSVSADNAGCTAQVIWLSPMMSDNCSGAVMTSSHNSGDVFSLGTTTVTYTATDIGGNTATCTFDITVTSDLTASVDLVTDIDCFGNLNGAIDVTTSGGGSPYTYSWNSGMYTTEDISGLAAGNYDLTVTDTYGCTATTNASISEPSALMINLDLSTDPTSCGASDGAINITVSGGTSPYIYDWNSGAFTTEDISNLIAGTYNLNLTDDNNCSATTSISLSDPGAPTITLDSIQHASCFGELDGAIYVAVTGGASPYVFDWDNDGTGDNDDMEDLIGVGTGSYSLTVIDDVGCTASLNNSINEPAAIDNSVTQSGNSLTANASGLSYQWMNCSTMNIIAGETAATFNASNNGDFAVIITDGSCSDTSACYQVEGIGVDEPRIELNVFPNPSTGQFHLNLNNSIEVVGFTIIDLSGKTVLQENFSTSKQSLLIDLSHQEAGTYLLFLNQENGQQIVRLIKQ